MALSQLAQDGLLGWLLGSPFPDPPVQTWLALHASGSPTADNEIKGWAGGDRLQVTEADFAAPTTAEGGGRKRVNSRAILLGVHDNVQTIESFALWDAPVGGSIVLTGAIDPSVTVQPGDPPIFLSGCLSLRSL